MKTVLASSLPVVTAEEMREIDRVMVEELHIELVQMMENAGRNLADLALVRFAPERVTILAGRGGNGGGGLVVARHLANRGAHVQVVLAHQLEELTAAARHQLEIVGRMGVTVTLDLPDADLVIDALIGYSLRGDPRGKSGDLIQWANRQPAPVLSLDIPSGLDATTGRARVPCVRATATMTLALPKAGLMRAREVGELYLADISVPPAAYRSLGLDVPALFRDGALLCLER